MRHFRIPLVVLVLLVVATLACGSSDKAARAPEGGLTLMPTYTATAGAVAEMVATDAPAPTDTAEAEATEAPPPTEAPEPAPTSLPPTDTVVPPIDAPPPADTPAPAPTAALGTPARVVSVTDGDTIEVEIDGQPFALRYIGIDTPEFGELMGPEATQANADLVAGQTVYLEKDTSETDPHDRLLRYVYLENGTMVNVKLVRLGWAEAKAYPPDTKYQTKLGEAQQEAQAAGRGRWGIAPAATPTVGPTSAAAGEVRIVKVFNSGSKEYVEIRNQGGAGQAMGGWRVWGSKGDEVFTFGAGYILGPGESVRLHSGEDGVDARPTDIYWTDKNVWNNKGETVFLQDGEGNAVHEHSY